MKILDKGQKLSLQNESVPKNFIVGINWDQSQVPNYEIDASVMLLSSRGKLEEEKDFIFYNNLQSSDAEVQMNTNPVDNYKKSFSINTDKINPAISRIIVVLTIDNGDKLNQRFSGIKNITVGLLDNKNLLLQYNVEGLTQETAVIAIEIYKHNNEWKIQAVGNGFNSGLDSILKEYGSEKVQVQPENTVAKPGPDLKKVEKLPAGSIDFIKKHKERIDLAKKQIAATGLTEQKAQVIIAMDISASMTKMFKSGLVQETFDRLLPLTLQFDDDGSIDVFLFHHDGFNHDVPYTLENREDYVQKEILAKYKWGATEYTPIMNMIVKKYRDAGKGSDPVFVLFFTDGDCTDKKSSEKIIKECSDKGIFWKFVGMGGEKAGVFGKKKGHGFDFLEKLDDMPGRTVDNANFIHIPDLKTITDDKLYQELLEEFPQWLKEVKSKNIISG